jgi:hypothetical protein
MACTPTQAEVNQIQHSLIPSLLRDGLPVKKYFLSYRFSLIKISERKELKNDS